jgi:hypothetical protein
MNRIMRIVRRFLANSGPLVIDFCCGASLFSPCPISPPPQWSTGTPLAGPGTDARWAAPAGADGSGAPLSPAEQRAWEHLARGLTSLPE